MRNTGSPRRPGAWIEVYWDNPPGPHQGLTVRRVIRGHVYERKISSGGLLNVQEAAEVLGLHYLSVYRAIKEGRLRAVRKIGGKLLIPLSEVKRYPAKVRRGRPPGRRGAKPAAITRSKRKRNPRRSGVRPIRPGALWGFDKHGRPWLSG